MSRFTRGKSRASRTTNSGRSARSRVQHRPMIESLENRYCPSVPVGWSIDEGGIADMRTEAVSATGKPIKPTEGSYMLWMSTTGSTATDPYTNSLNEPGTMGTIVRGPSTALRAGDTVSLDYYFSSNDYAPYNDFAIGLVSGTELFKITQIATKSFASGWKSASMSVKIAGTYQLVLVVSDQADSSVDTDLFVDHLTGFTLLDSPGVPGPTQVTIATAGDTAFEAYGSSASFVVKRAGDITGDLTVNYSISGTATAGADFTALPGTVLIPAGQNSATIWVTPIDDTDPEATELVDIAIDPGNYEVGFPNTASIQIVDNDTVLPEVTIEATDPTAAETGGNNGVFTVTRSGSTAAPLTVYYSVYGSAVSGKDFVALPGQVVIPAGSSSATITVTPIDDDLGEAEESVAVAINFPSDFSYEVGWQSTAMVSIAMSDGGQATVTIDATTPTALEEGLSPGFFTFTRSGGNLAVPLTVQYQLYGTATAGVDFEALSGTVTIKANKTTEKIKIKPIQDALGELNELVYAAISWSPEGDYAVGYPGGYDAVTIVDNDGGLASVSLATTKPTVSEAGPGTATFTLTRTGGNLAIPLTVNYYTYGSATAGLDSIPFNSK